MTNSAEVHYNHSATKRFALALKLTCYHYFCSQSLLWLLTVDIQNHITFGYWSIWKAKTTKTHFSFSCLFVCISRLLDTRTKCNSLYDVKHHFDCINIYVERQVVQSLVISVMICTLSQIGTVFQFDAVYIFTDSTIVFLY